MFSPLLWKHIHMNTPYLSVTIFISCRLAFLCYCIFVYGFTRKIIIHGIPNTPILYVWKVDFWLEMFIKTKKKSTLGVLLALARYRIAVANSKKQRKLNEASLWVFDTRGCYVV